MSLDSAYALIRARFISQWQTIEPTVSYGFPNENFQRDPGGGEFIIMEVKWLGGEGMTIGVPGFNRARRDGRVTLHCFVPIGTGQSRAMQMGSRAASIFEDQDLGGGVVFEAMMPGGGESGTDDGLYYGEAVDIPYSLSEPV